MNKVSEIKLFKKGEKIMEYNYKEIGIRIRKRRKQTKFKDSRAMIDEIKNRGYTKGIGYNKYLDIENGLSNELDLKLLEIIAEILNCTTDYLLCKTDYTTDSERIAGEYLGLSPASIQFLHSIRHESISATLDYLLANHYGDFSNMLSNYTKSLFHFNACNAASVKFDGKLDPKEIEEIKEDQKTYSDASILEVMHILQLIRDNMIYDSYRANRNMHEALYEELKNKE